MTDIDTVLARLREMPAHPDLASMDAVILAAVSARTARRPLSASVFGIAALGALSIGLAASMVPQRPTAGSSLALVGGEPALAPSHLLGDHE
ncbi:MAG: hypothetical protein EOP61_29590 [Sphingomonadales bacterium]|nr:MAG: hypothetical protein EOP61_29590 [Sphingomonadales bacterium]